MTAPRPQAIRFDLDLNAALATFRIIATAPRIRRNVNPAGLRGRSLTVIVLSAFLLSLAYSQTVAAPAGWTSRQNGAAQEFIPDAHPNGEFTLDVYVDSPSPIADQWSSRV
jgi:hypothetical protein